MGSFDSVCGLSNMAIGDGDPVVAMALRKNPFGTYELSPLFPYTMWEPASVLSRGHYADYGNVDLDDDGEAWKLTQQKARRWMERVWVEPFVDANGRERSGYWGMRDTTLEYTFTADGKRADLREDNPTVFTLWMAHAGIYDKLAETVTAEFFNNGAVSASDVPVCEVADRVILNARNIMAGEIPKDYEKLFNAIGEDAERFKHALRYTRNPWKAGNSYDSNPVSDYFEEAIYDAFDEGDMELYEKLIAHFRDSHMLSTMLYQMRKSVTPPGTIGPQHGHDQPFLALADAVREQAERNRIKYDYDEDEDDDIAN